MQSLNNIYVTNGIGNGIDAYSIPKYIVLSRKRKGIKSKNRTPHMSAFNGIQLKSAFKLVS